MSGIKGSNPPKEANLKPVWGGWSSKWRHFSGVFGFFGVNFSLLVFFLFQSSPQQKNLQIPKISITWSWKNTILPKAHQFLKVYFNNIRFQGSSIVGYRMYRQLIQPTSNLNNFFGGITDLLYGLDSTKNI